MNRQIDGRAALAIIFSSIFLIVLIIPVLYPWLSSIVAHGYINAFTFILGLSLSVSTYWATKENDDIIKFVKGLSDLVWNFWTFCGLLALISPTFGGTSFDLKGKLEKLADCPIIYSIVIISLVFTAATRMATAYNAFRNR